MQMRLGGVQTRLGAYDACVERSIRVRRVPRTLAAECELGALLREASPGRCPPAGGERVRVGPPRSQN